MEHLLHLAEQQWQIFEQMTRFELRISLECLPKHYYQLEPFVMPDLYTPMVKNASAIELKQKRSKLIQAIKRRWLQMELDTYEQRYREYEIQYQHALKQLEILSSTRLYSDSSHVLYRAFLAYIDHRSNRLQHQFFDEKIRLLRKQLLFTGRLRRKKKGSSSIPVAPSMIVDLLHHPFTYKEVAYLSRGTSLP